VQASQQLGLLELTHAVPFFAGLHALGDDFVLQLVLPCESVRQQVTKPDLPHVECAAHFTTAPLQLWLVSVAFACFAAHET
jgi:hypothetical protein